MTAGGRDDLSLIVDAARAAGALALTLRNAGLETRYKAGDSPVTNADLACDALLTERLRAARPDYGWLSEETADDRDRLSRRRVFMVDPIDGTRDFLRGRLGWVVSIAVVEDGRPIAGAIFAPQADQTFTAVAGGGATLDGRPIRCSTVSALEGAGMVGDKGFFSHPGWPRPWPPLRVESRNATAYRMCLVASGEFDGAIALVPKHDWDLAAGDLIAREAGAACGDHHGRPFRFNGPIPQQPSLVCAAAGLAPLILERLGHIALPERTAPNK
ncbi:3'(2'),5'-bisphosphate nucleotidase CysQ [Phenylobacterium sp.]|jgi:myo-inositol-1(or 4)-monophosphatase|uniref:3'(2'),5'-bisphosphate nucleotidase CysQ n=1 Tax=Phenylobacterium sp. TaxID=1871053 RepID=UPI002F3F7601